MQNEIFHINTAQDFTRLALSVFKHQFEHNAVYRSFCDLLYVHPAEVTSLDQIPFLPIQFFKSHEVITSRETPKITFTSSGTTGSIPSTHRVSDISWYEQSFRTAFEHFYGDISSYTVLALLPNYLEREGSSLIYMVKDFIEKSNSPKSGFYLDDLDGLAATVSSLDAQGEKVLVIGVSFALLDLIERHSFSLKHTIIMETGGMKGRRKELIRNELHEHLCRGFGVDVIHSEYGMTELLSQAYSKGNGVFECPPWMKVLVRDTEDPFHMLPPSKTGGLNIIDLANYNSCSFIATQDLGKLNTNGTFEVLGRFDHSDIRGCNLMVF